MKKLWRLSLPLLLAALLLTACGRTAEEVPLPEETPPAVDIVPAVEEPETPEEDPVPEGASALTAEEIAQVNEVFTPVYTDEEKNVSWANPLDSFFTCLYQTPEEIDLAAFLYHFSPGSEPSGEEEFQALKAAEDWPFGDIARDRMPVPIHKYLRSDVDAALMEHTGVTTADLTGANTGDLLLLYLEEYDAYYNFTSDFGPGVFQCESGWYTDTEARLTGVNAVLTLRKQGDHWLFQSFLPVEDGGQ